MNKVITLVGALVLLLVFAFYMCSFKVRSTEIAVLKTFGKFEEDDIKTAAGLYRKWPWPIQTKVVTDNRIRILKDAYEETQTRDSQNIMVMTYTAWKIDERNPYQFHIANNSSERAAEDKLRSLIQARKKSVVAQHDLADFVNTDVDKFKFDEIEDELLRETAATAKREYGIEIKTVGIRRLSFPKTVSEEIFKRMKTTEEGKAAKYLTEGQAEAQAIVSRASAIARNILAVAERLAKEIRGEADAEVGRFYKEFDEHVELRLFLDQLEATVRSLRERSTLILDRPMAPFNLFEFMPASANTAERTSSTAAPGERDTPTSSAQVSARPAE